MCGRADNPIIASEAIEVRFGIPLMPEERYDFARCDQCGTLYVDSDIDDAYLTHIYEGETQEVGELSADSQKAAAAILALRLPEFQRHWELLKQLRPPRAGDQLLDMGCQTGDFGALALADGVQPSGIELSHAYADRCQERWGPAATVLREPAETADFGQRRFQYVTAFETLEHMCDPKSALAHLSRWVAPDGVVALSVPSSDYFQFKYWLLKSTWPGKALLAALRRYRPFYGHRVLPHTHIYNFTPRSAVALAESAALTPVYLGLTGWHGIGRLLGAPAGAVAFAATGTRVGFAPSVLLVARLAGRA
jgi:2-polyprenyl-3-methyl-5-hydroxy-6-metoxy-1,4-benzoquinol methylase